MGAPPPSRYRVVEQGRRLVVVDRWAEGGRPAPVSPRSSTATARNGWFRQTRFDGGGELTTRAFYDAKGPRTIRLDPTSARLVKLAPAAIAAVSLLFLFLFPFGLIAAAAVLFQQRDTLRDRVTAWLDRVGREAG